MKEEKEKEQPPAYQKGISQKDRGKPRIPEQVNSGEEEKHVKRGLGSETKRGKKREDNTPTWVGGENRGNKKNVRPRGEELRESKSAGRRKN